MGNFELGKKVNQQNSLLVQSHCDKHEYVMVTQTTTNNAPINPVNESSHWLQCKHCGQCIPMPQQKLHN
jgi:hypothetical protein